MKWKIPYYSNIQWPGSGNWFACGVECTAGHLQTKDMYHIKTYYIITANDGDGFSGCLLSVSRLYVFAASYFNVFNTHVDGRNLFFSFILITFKKA